MMDSGSEEHPGLMLSDVALLDHAKVALAQAGFTAHPGYENYWTRELGDDRKVVIGPEPLRDLIGRLTEMRLKVTILAGGHWVAWERFSVIDVAAAAHWTG